MDADLLAEALTRLPRKGETEWPGKDCFVVENLHDWAVEQGFLSGALFKKPKKWGKKTTWKYRLILVGPCPWTPGNLRYYSVPVTPPHS